MHFTGFVSRLETIFALAVGVGVGVVVGVVAVLNHTSLALRRKSFDDKIFSILKI